MDPNTRTRRSCIYFTPINMKKTNNLIFRLLNRKRINYQRYKLLPILKERAVSLKRLPKELCSKLELLNKRYLRVNNRPICRPIHNSFIKLHFDTQLHYPLSTKNITIKRLDVKEKILGGQLNWLLNCKRRPLRTSTINKSFDLQHKDNNFKVGLLRNGTELLEKIKKSNRNLRSYVLNY